MRIAVVGLGKLGSPIAAVLAMKGHEVVGIDQDPYIVHQLNAGNAPAVEPQLQATIDAAKGRLRATTSYREGIPQAHITFIIVPTPSNERGVFSNKYVLSAVKHVGEALRNRKDYHLVNITSTVMPGATSGELLNCLESASGRKVGDTLGLTYNPEFIALGSVVHDLLHPDMILIGESDKTAGDLLEALYRTTLDDCPSVQRMNWINAEVTKIALNTYVTTKITFANMLCELCEALPGADVNVVTRALGVDARIGGKYLRGALGYGGPCFPRDNVAFTRLAADLGVRADLAQATHSLNLHQVARLNELVNRLSPKGATVAVLGMAYKPDTPVIERSQGVMLASELAKSGRRVVIYDPIALDHATAALGDRVERASSATEAASMADIIVIATECQEFRAIPSSAFQRPPGTRALVIDCWRLLSDAVGQEADVIHLGVGQSEAASPIARLRWASGS